MTGMDERLARVAEALHRSNEKPDHVCDEFCAGYIDLATPLAPLLTQWQAEDETTERERIALAIATEMWGDEYEVNAMSAASEGDWSWFCWLAVSIACREGGTR